MSPSLSLSCTSNTNIRSATLRRRLTADYTICEGEIVMQPKTNGETLGPDSTVEGPADAAALVEEDAALRERLLRALADTENVRRRADRLVDEARQYGISDLARELLVPRRRTPGPDRRDGTT
jgi:molecular chaperone GrpE (heat shock protein)